MYRGYVNVSEVQCSQGLMSPRVNVSVVRWFEVYTVPCYRGSIFLRIAMNYSDISVNIKPYR